MTSIAHGDDRVKPLLSVLAIVFLTSVSLKLIALPINRAVEDRFCLAYFQQHDPEAIGQDGHISEQQCKIAPVQSKVGFLIGALETLTAGCDILSAAPLAYLADTLGRGRILSLNVAATLLRLVAIVAVVSSRVLSPWLMLLGPVLSIFGGSVSLTTSLSLAIANDVAQNEVQRSTYISWLYCLPFVAGMIGPSIAAATMIRSVNIPLLLASSLSLLALLLARNAHVQDTDRKRRSSGATIESSSLLSRGDDISGTRAKTDNDLLHRLAELCSPASIAAMWSSYASLLRDKPAFRILLASFFCTGAASASSYLLPLLLSSRFGWSFAQIGIIFSFKAIVNLTMSIVVVPAYSARAKTRQSASSQVSRADTLGSYATLSISAIGAVLIATASSKLVAILALCVYAVGSVAGTFMYALARSPGLALLDGTDDARGYTMIVLVHSLGGFMGSPLMAWLWAGTLDQANSAQGAPFFVSALMYLIALSVISQLH